MGGGEKERLEGAPETVLAVVLADSYDSGLAPLTSTSPLCLLPLAGRPLLDLTLESLRLGGITEVLLYLSSHPAKVKSWLATSRWSQTVDPVPLIVTVIVNEECRSVGDACRDLDGKGVVRSEFVLVGAGACLVAGAGLHLDRALERHKARAAKDKHAVMTYLYTTARPGHPLRQAGQELVVATDKANDQVLFFQRSGNTSYNFPIELFQQQQIELLFDLGDPGLVVCHPAVLALFSDNFDLQTMDALTGEILDSDLVDSTLYLDRLEEVQAARVNSPYKMLEVERMLRQRWFHPQVPDMPGSEMSLQKHSVYRGRGCSVGQGSTVKEGVVVGGRTQVGARSTLHNTSLGPGVRIGEDCSLKHCVVMEGAVLGRGLVLDSIIVGRNALIPEGVILGSKCLLGEGVQLRPGVKLPERSRVSAEQEDDWGEEVSEEDSLGPKAFLYTEEEDEEDPDDVLEDEKVLVKDWWGKLYIEDDDDVTEASSEEGSDLEDEFSGEEDEEEEEEGEHDDVKNFRREVIDSIERGGNTDNLVLEINGSKHAWNTTLSEVNQCVIYAVLTAGVDTSLPPSSLLSAASANIKKFLGLLQRYCQGEVKQKYYLAGLEDLVIRDQAWLGVLPKILHLLFEKDVLEDTAILSWMEEDGKDKDIKTRIRDKSKAFIEWLEEDSDSEED